MHSFVFTIVVVVVVVVVVVGNIVIFYTLVIFLIHLLEVRWGRWSRRLADK